MEMVGRHKDKKQVVVYLPHALHQRLRLQSARVGKSMSELVEQALGARLGKEQRVPIPSRPEVERPEVVDALVMYGAPLWSSGRPTQLSLEEAVTRGLALARHHPSLLRVLPVVLFNNRSRLTWDELRSRAADLRALGMLLDLTAEVTGVELFRSWACALSECMSQEPPTPFFERSRGGRYLELAQLRTPGVVKKWGFLMATPIDDFQAAVRRFCPDLPDSTART